MFRISLLIHKNNFNYIELKSIERYAGVTSQCIFDGIKILYGMLKIKKGVIASRLWSVI